MITNNISYKPGIWVIVSFIVFIFIFLLYFINTIELIEGDPAIYLSFAKYFFKKPFSFGDLERVSFGATSPVYLLIISTIYALFSLDNFLVVLKLINSLFYFLSIFFTWKSVELVLNNWTQRDQEQRFFSRSETFSLVCLSNLVFINLIDNSFRLFETAFVCFFVSLLIYIFLNKKILLLAFVGSIAYLVRPEVCIIYFFLFFLSIFIFHRREIRGQFFLVLLFLSVAPTFLYHAYMFAHLGEILPSSVLSRSSRVSDYSILSSNWIQIRANPQLYLVLIWTLWLFLDYFLIKKKSLRDGQFRVLNVVNFFVCTLFVIVLIFSKSNSARYIEFLIPFIAFGLVIHLPALKTKLNNPKKKILLTFISLAVFFSTFKYLYPEYSDQSNLTNRLSPDLAKEFTKISPDGAKIAMYEIQTQYFLDRKVISLDSRVGREMYLFISGHEQLIEALQRNKIEYLGVDRHASFLIRNDPLYKFLLEIQNKSIIGQDFIYSFGNNSFRVTKVLQNNTESKAENSLSMWDSVFYIKKVNEI
tara:strand:- start:565 stop:2157 length:1593 start_codon:yes stop_codon:yes gene_type:complete